MLLDENMLPRIKREIPQVLDLLRAEQSYLDVILNMAEWLGDRMILLKEEVMNIPNLRAKIRQITGWDCDILEDAEHLTLTIRYYFNAQEPVLNQEAKILMYIPAHLKVIYEFLQSYAGQTAVYAGAGMGYYTRYKGYMQEINGASSGTASTSLEDGLFIHTKIICYPEV